METSQLLTTLLVSIGYRLPILIALGVAVVMLLDTPSGRVRSVAMWGLSVLIGVTLVGGAASVLPLLLVASDQYERLSQLNMLLGIVHFGLSLLEALGFILLAWALVQALRRPLPPARP